MSEILYPVDLIKFYPKIKGRVSALTIESIVERYKNGCSLKDIATHMDCSKNKVRDILKRSGLELRTNAIHVTHRRPLKSGKQAALPYYGFCYFEGKIIKDPREYPVLLKIHRGWKDGMTIHQITSDLNQARIPSRKGRMWSWAAVRNIVTRFEEKIFVQTKSGGLEFRKKGASER